jgi:hypothetical protein
MKASPQRRTQPKVDSGIRREVQVLRDNGIDTTESCQGGNGHSFSEPTVRFNRTRDEGFKALAIALAHGLRVYALRRSWRILDGEPVGPE